MKGTKYSVVALVVVSALLGTRVSAEKASEVSSYEKTLAMYTTLVKNNSYKMPRASDIALISHAMAFVGFQKELLLFSGNGAASRYEGIPFLMCCGEDDDLLQKLFTVFHELGHLVDKDLDEADGDLALVARYKENTLKALNALTANTAQALKATLRDHPDLASTAVAKHNQKDHEAEKRADLFALTELNRIHSLCPILKMASVYASSTNYRVPGFHPTDLERALYHIGSLLEGRSYTELDAMLKEFEETGSCRGDANIDWLSSKIPDGVRIFPDLAHLEELSQYLAK